MLELAKKLAVITLAGPLPILSNIVLAMGHCN